MTSEIKAEPTASMKIVAVLADSLVLAGVPRAALLRAAGLSEEQLEAPDARKPYSTLWRICELAMELSADPALGLHWAEAGTSHAFIPLAQLIAHAASLREGLASLARFERLLTDEPNSCLLEEGELAIVRCTPALQRASDAMKRFAADMMVASFLRIVRTFNPLAQPERVCFAHAAPSYLSEYERVLGAPPLFDQPHTELVFARTLLDTRSPLRDADVHDALQTLAHDRITRLTQGASYALRVRDHLLKGGYKDGKDMESVARALGTSVRSLRRRLDDEGKSYGDVANEALAIVASQLLRDRKLTIQETAFAMGFNNASTFHRAFKRWTGTTPNAIKRTP